MVPINQAPPCGGGGVHDQKKATSLLNCTKFKAALYYFQKLKKLSDTHNMYIDIHVYKYMYIYVV